MTFLDPGSESRIGNRRAVNWLYRAANLLGFWKIVDRKIADFGFILQIIGSVHAAGALANHWRPMARLLCSSTCRRFSASGAVGLFM
jgi:hypothetical protein